MTYKHGHIQGRTGLRIIAGVLAAACFWFAFRGPADDSRFAVFMFLIQVVGGIALAAAAAGVRMRERRQPPGGPE